MSIGRPYLFTKEMMLDNVQMHISKDEKRAYCPSFISSDFWPCYYWSDKHNSYACCGDATSEADAISWLNGEEVEMCT